MSAMYRFTMVNVYKKKNHPRYNYANDLVIMARAYPAVVGQSMGVNVIAKYSR